MIFLIIFGTLKSHFASYLCLWFKPIRNLYSSVLPKTMSEPDQETLKEIIFEKRQNAGINHVEQNKYGFFKTIRELKRACFYGKPRAGQVRKLTPIIFATFIGPRVRKEFETWSTLRRLTSSRRGPWTYAELTSEGLVPRENDFSRPFIGTPILAPMIGNPMTVPRPDVVQLVSSITDDHHQLHGIEATELSFSHESQRLELAFVSLLPETDLAFFDNLYCKFGEASSWDQDPASVIVCDSAETSQSLSSAISINLQPFSQNSKVERHIQTQRIYFENQQLDTLLSKTPARTKVRLVQEQLLQLEINRQLSLLDFYLQRTDVGGCRTSTRERAIKKITQLFEKLSLRVVEEISNYVKVYERSMDQLQDVIRDPQKGRGKMQKRQSARVEIMVIEVKQSLSFILSRLRHIKKLMFQLENMSAAISDLRLKNEFNSMKAEFHSQVEQALAFDIDEARHSVLHLQQEWKDLVPMNDQ